MEEEEVAGEERERGGKEVKREEKSEKKKIENKVEGGVGETSETDIRSIEVWKVKDIKVPPITKVDYYMMLRQYAMSHTRIREKGEKGFKEVEGKSDEDVNRVYWLDENLDPETGKFYRIYRIKPCF